jgi:hypothetical protein
MSNFYTFFIDMHIGNVGDDEHEGAASAPMLNTLSQYTRLFFLKILPLFLFLE